MGYPTEAKAWLVWDPVGKKVHTSRDVRFIEAVPGSTPVSVPAAQSAGSYNDSTSIVAAEPADAERSIIVDALVTDDVESGSDSDDEAEAVEPSEPAVAVVPAAVAVDQPVGPLAPQLSTSPVAPAASPTSTSVSSPVSLSSRQSQQGRLSKRERELRKENVRSVVWCECRLSPGRRDAVVLCVVVSFLVHFTVCCHHCSDLSFVCSSRGSVH